MLVSCSKTNSFLIKSTIFNTTKKYRYRPKFWPVPVRYSIFPVPVPVLQYRPIPALWVPKVLFFAWICFLYFLEKRNFLQFSKGGCELKSQKILNPKGGSAAPLRNPPAPASPLSWRASPAAGVSTSTTDTDLKTRTLLGNFGKNQKFWKFSTFCFLVLKKRFLQ